MNIKIFASLLLMVFLIVSCGTDNNDEEKETLNPREIPLPKSGDNISEKAKRVQLNLLISESKKTLDSINIAYKVIAKERRMQNLSMYEKEHVNQALMELNDAKDLIILETQQAVINELKEKAASLQGVMNKMNAASEKLANISQTLSRVSAVIEKTTNILASALTAGIVRPKITEPDEDSKS